MKKLAFATAIGLGLLFGFSAHETPAMAQTKSAEGGKPLKGVVRPARRGGYSYKYTQGINTRRFVDRTKQEQTPMGPFDSGFFFSSPVGPRGGDSPYMN
jgi:hypothetical protein